MKNSPIIFCGYMENQAHLWGHENLETTCYLIVTVRQKTENALKIVFHCSFPVDICNCFSVRFFPSLYHFYDY